MLARDTSRMASRRPIGEADQGLWRGRKPGPGVLWVWGTGFGSLPSASFSVHSASLNPRLFLSSSHALGFDSDEEEEEEEEEDVDDSVPSLLPLEEERKRLGRGR